MGLVRKILLVAAVDGLILQPLAPANAGTSLRQSSPAILVRYKTHRIESHAGPPSSEDEHAGQTIHGVIGLLRIAGSAYLLGISRRELVARIWGRPVYVVTGVVVVPLSSQREAAAALHRGAREAADDDADTSADEDYESDDGDSLDLDLDLDPSGSEHGNPTSAATRQPGIAEEVLGRKGTYGRFTDRWFSRRGWIVGQRLEPSFDGRDADQQAYQRWPQTPSREKSLEDAFPLPGPANEALTSSLLPKLVRTTKLLFASRTFFFSYDFDITRRLATQRRTHPTASTVTLHRECDPEYFWNNHLLQPFIQDGLDAFAMPLMQGFVGQRQFVLGRLAKPTLPGPIGEVPLPTTDPEAEPRNDLVESVPCLITLVSRRSTRRSGLRYLRRGIDEEGNVANAVETEQLLSSPFWDPESPVYSFVQARGSIPLFFSQLPYSFKPPPVLHATPEINLAAMQKHFGALSSRYGRVQAISLVDRHGPETAIGEAYESTIKKLNGDAAVPPVDFTWFEFHAVCRGMKFENVSLLVQQMLPFLSSSGFTTIESGKQTTSQTGIVRTNCMDCLDRTNVVQSALAQHTLSLQLAAAGLSINLSTDPSTIWFNSLWADNGDAVSRAYTGTSALKGDYTRTRKRNALGALTDLTLTLSRYHRNLFDDFFAQAAIDRLLGIATDAVFADFEATMTSADPAIDLPRAREQAIAASAALVVADPEDLLHGWCLLVPAAQSSPRALPLAEALLLLTDKALYFVRFDWDARRVERSERVPLLHLRALHRGAYITHTHHPSQTDAASNTGFAIRTLASECAGDMSPAAAPPSSAPPDRPGVVRVNTRSLENAHTARSLDLDPEQSGQSRARARAPDPDDAGQPGGAAQRTLAFKALQTSGHAWGGRGGEREAVACICEDIRAAAAGAAAAAGGGSEAGRLVVEERDVLGLEEARRSTGLMESLTYSLKRAIWG